MEIIFYVLIGIFGGVLGGMGMGGGTIIIPLLTICLGITQKLAQGYNLLAFLIMAIIVIVIHTKNKLIDFKSIILIIVFGVVCCVGGAFLTTIVDTKILKYIFAGFLILLAIYEFISVVKK